MYKLFLTIFFVFIFLTCSNNKTAEHIEDKNLIYIGALLPITGTQSSSGELCEATLKIAVESVNDYLELQGHKKSIKLIIENTATDPNTALKKLKLLYEKGIRVIIGPQTSAECKMVLDYSKENDIVLISFGSTASSLALSDDNLFRLTPDDSKQAQAIASYMKKNGIETLYPIWRDDEWGNELKASVEEVFINAGRKVEEGFSYKTDNADFSNIIGALNNSVLNKIQRVNPKTIGVVIIGFASETIKIFNEAINYSVLTDIQWFGTDGQAQDNEILKNNSAIKFIEQTGFPCAVYLHDPAMQPSPTNFLPKLYIKEKIVERINREPNAYSLNAWDGLWLAALSYVHSDWTDSSAVFIKSFKNIANSSVGLNGTTELNDAGDKEYGEFGFYEIREIDGIYRWQLKAVYHNNPYSEPHFTYPKFKPVKRDVILKNLLEIIGTMLAGLAIFFLGINLMSDNLKMMTTQKIRLFISKWTKNAWLAGLWGFIAGAILQSCSIVAFIVAGMINSGLMTVKKALPVIVWCCAGSSALVLILTLNIQLGILFLIGVSGLMFAFKKPLKLYHFFGALVGIGLLFMGLSMVQQGSSGLYQFTLFKRIIEITTANTFLAFIIGTLLTFITQSSIGICIVAITMAGAGVFNIDQTIMLIYSSNAGSSLITLFLATGLKGAPKQIAMSHVIINLFGCLIFVPLFYIENYTGIPAMKYLVGLLSDNIELQMSYLNVLYNIFTVLIISFLLNPLYYCLTKFWSVSAEEEEAKPQYLHLSGLADLETGVGAIVSEQNRLFKRFIKFMNNWRIEKETGQNLLDTISVAHNSFISVIKEIRNFIEALQSKTVNLFHSDSFLFVLSRQEILETLEINIFEFIKTDLEKSQDGNNKMPLNQNSSEYNKITQNFLESLDTVLLTLNDWIELSDKNDIQFLAVMTDDKSNLIEKLKNNYLNRESALSLFEKSKYLSLLNRYERIIWLLNRLAVLENK
jgi:phosphate:Na+ symporter